MAERAADLGRRRPARHRPAAGRARSRRTRPRRTRSCSSRSDLAPADTALLDLDKVLALITTEGGPTSHTAILAREKSIPAIVGAAGEATWWTARR